MKEADFQNLLQGIREAGADLRGNKMTSTHVDRIASRSVTAIRAQLRLSLYPRSSA